MARKKKTKKKKVTAAPQGGVHSHFTRSGSGAHHTREDDVRRGSSRKPKHKHREVV